MGGLDYLDHLARESARFAEVIRGVPPQARVPSCPDWNADDLLWHLGEVQWFWGTIVREQVTGGEAERLKPPRPAGRPGLLTFFERASRGLGEALAATDPGAAAWTWSDDQTAGFVRRRQAHEALIHRVDAELAAGARGPMDPRLCADGVDEVLRVMFGGDVPGWGSFTPAGAKALQMRATDTGDVWLLTIGRFTGTDPRDQATYDEPAIEVRAGAAGGAAGGAGAAAWVSGGAADLDCWLWNRPPSGQLARGGDQDILSRFDGIRAPGIN